jgi:hypothetical protein
VDAVSENRFEVLVDIDVGAECVVFQVGIEHYVLGPPCPAFYVEAGDVNVKVNVHRGDIDAMISALKKAKKLIDKTTGAA